MLKWIKIGDFKPNPDAVSWDKIVEYRYSEPYLAHVEKLIVLGYPDGSIGIKFVCPMDELFEDPTVQKYFANFGNERPRVIGIERTTDKEIIKMLLTIINKHDSIEEIVNEIYAYCDLLRKPEEEVAAETSAYVEEGKFLIAIDSAKRKQNEGYFEIIWEVANSLHEIYTTEPKLIPLYQLIEVYEAISENNPHYKEANNRLVILYQPGTIIRREKDPYAHLEKQLEASIKAENLRLTDQVFHQLCGYKDLNPKVRNIKGDVTMLIALASQIRELNLALKEEKKLTEELSVIKKKEGPAFF